VEPTGKPKKAQAPPPAAKPAVPRAKAGKNLRELVRKVSMEHQGLNGKEKAPWKASDSKTLKKYGPVRPNEADSHSLKPVRSIAGLTIADFLYDR